MATRTLLQIKTAMAGMLGFESFSDLPTQDQADIVGHINSALFECFDPIDGHKPEWPSIQISDILKAPSEATLSLTFGSKIITGYTFESKYAGSAIVIGGRAFTYAGKDLSGKDVLVQPWDRDTGSQSATIYHNCVRLSSNVIEVFDTPSLLGAGLLSPMPNVDSETFLSSEPANDFVSRIPNGEAYQFDIRRNRVLRTGEPEYYRISQESIEPALSFGSSFRVFPFPDRSYIFELRARVYPSELKNDEEIPPIPANAVAEIFIPLVRERIANNFAGRLYTGDPRFIAGEAARARAQLKRLSRPQRQHAASIRLRKGW